MFGKLGRRKSAKDKFSSSEPASLVYVPFDDNGKAEVHLNLRRPGTGGGHRDYYPPPPPKTNNNSNSSSIPRRNSNSHTPRSPHPPLPPKIEPCLRSNKKYGETCDEIRANEIADGIEKLVQHHAEKHSHKRGEAPNNNNMYRRNSDEKMDISRLHDLGGDKMNSRSSESKEPSTPQDYQQDEIAWLKMYRRNSGVMDVSRLHNDLGDKMNSSSQSKEPSTTQDYQQDEIATEPSSTSTSSKGEEKNCCDLEGTTPMVDEMDELKKVKLIAEGIKKLIIMKQVQDHLTPGEIKNIREEPAQSPQTSKQSYESMKSPQTPKQSHDMYLDINNVDDHTQTPKSPSMWKEEKAPNTKSPSIWQEVKGSISSAVPLDHASIASKNIIERNYEPNTLTEITEGHTDTIGKTVYVPSKTVEKGGLEGLALLGGRQRGGPALIADQSVVSDLTMMEHLFNPVSKTSRNGRPQPPPPPRRNWNNQNPPPPPPPRRQRNSRRRSTTGTGVQHSNNSRTSPTFVSPPVSRRVIHVDKSTPPVAVASRGVHVKSGVSPTCLSESCPNVNVPQDGRDVTRVWARRLPPPPLATEHHEGTKDKNRALRRRSSPLSMSSLAAVPKEEEAKNNEEEGTKAKRLPPPPPWSQTRITQTQEKKKSLGSRGRRNSSSSFSKSCPDNIADFPEGDEQYGTPGPLSPNPTQSAKHEEGDTTPCTAEPQEQYKSYPPPPPSSGTRPCPVSPFPQRVAFDKSIPRGPGRRRRSESSSFSMSCPDFPGEEVEEQFGPLTSNPIQSHIHEETDTTPSTAEAQENESYPPSSSTLSPGTRPCQASPFSKRPALDKSMPRGSGPHSRRYTSSDCVNRDEPVTRKSVRRRPIVDAYSSTPSRNSARGPCTPSERSIPKSTPNTQKMDFSFNENGCCRVHTSEVIAKKKPFGGWDIKRGGCVLCKLDLEEMNRGSTNADKRAKSSWRSHHTRRHSSGDRRSHGARRSSQNSICKENEKQTKHPLTPKSVKHPQRDSFDSFPPHSARRSSLNSSLKDSENNLTPRNMIQQQKQARSKSREQKPKTEPAAPRRGSHRAEDKTPETKPAPQQKSSSSAAESTESKESAAGKSKTVSDLLYKMPWGMEGLYSGDVTHGKPHGYGTIQFTDGGNYSGHWEHGYSRWFTETCLPVLEHNKNFSKQQPDHQTVMRDDGIIVKYIGAGLILSTDGANTVLLSSDGSSYTVPMAGGEVQDEAARRPRKSHF